MAIDPSICVLVVDDNTTTIHIVRKLLWQIGFVNVDDAQDGATALSRMRAKRYGLVISDWNMAPMTGYELLCEIRSGPNLARTPFYHGHGRIQDRKRHGGQQSKRKWLHPQTV